MLCGSFGPHNPPALDRDPLLQPVEGDCASPFCPCAKSYARFLPVSSLDRPGHDRENGFCVSFAESERGGEKTAGSLGAEQLTDGEAPACRSHSRDLTKIRLIEFLPISSRPLNQKRNVDGGRKACSGYHNGGEAARPVQRIVIRPSQT